MKKIITVLFLVASANLSAFAQAVKFTDSRDTSTVEYSNFEKIERAMQSAVKEKKDKIAAIYRARIYYDDLDAKGLTVKRSKIVVFIMLYAVTPFRVMSSVELIGLGDKTCVAPQGTIFPELDFSQKEFDGIKQGTKITAFGRDFGKIDKKMIKKFPIVEVKRKKVIWYRTS